MRIYFVDGRNLKIVITSLLYTTSYKFIYSFLVQIIIILKSLRYHVIPASISNIKIYITYLHIHHYNLIISHDKGFYEYFC